MSDIHRPFPRRCACRRTRRRHARRPRRHRRVLVCRRDRARARSRARRSVGRSVGQGGRSDREVTRSGRSLETRRHRPHDARTRGGGREGKRRDGGARGTHRSGTRVNPSARRERVRAPVVRLARVDGRRQKHERALGRTRETNALERTRQSEGRTREGEGR